METTYLSIQSSLTVTIIVGFFFVGLGWLKSKKTSKHKIMNKEDVISFMQTYQRITENMFKKMTKYASILVNLGSDHQINSIKYN